MKIVQLLCHSVVLLFLLLCTNHLVIVTEAHQSNVINSYTSTNNYWDIIVYGATPAGIMASISAAQEGSTVLLLDARNHSNIGGMMTGGLSISDVGSTIAVIGGRTLQFFLAVGQMYGNAAGVPEWNFEPKIAKKVFQMMLDAAAPNLTVQMNTRLVSMERNNGSILSSATDSLGRVYAAKVWIDCSYEGYLLPLSGVSFTYGRESVEQYNESVAGVIPEPHIEPVPGHEFSSQPQLPKGINPYADSTNSTLIPLVQSIPPGPIWSGDQRTQAYNFRITLTNDSSNMIPFPKPSSYDPKTFELFRRAIAAGNWTSASQVLWGSALPNPTKFDCNVQLMDWIGESYEYPIAVANGSFDVQNELWRRHVELTLGYLWFMSHDESVPESIRNGMKEWGLARDEFIDNEGTIFPLHFPPQLYTREVLRMVGQFVFTQWDREVNVTKDDSVGMGSYSIDVLHVSRYANSSYGVLMEGGIQAPAFLPASLPPFEIPYRVMLPSYEECTNLLVPVAVSASHVGFCAIRLEPTWMILGESAGIAAHQAIQEASGSVINVQTISISTLQKRLAELNQVLHL